MHATRTTLVLGLALLGPAAGWVAAQESVALMRLDQQVASLRAQLDFETQQLRQRIERLEEGVRRRDGPGPLQPLPGPVPPAVAGTHSAAEFTARRFVVEDAEGRIRAVLADSARYGPMLALLDESGDLRVLVAQGGPDSAGLEVLDAAGASRIRLSLEDGEPALRLYDGQGRETQVAPRDAGDARQ